MTNIDPKLAPEFTEDLEKSQVTKRMGFSSRHRLDVIAAFVGATMGLVSSLFSSPQVREPIFLIGLITATLAIIDFVTLPLRRRKEMLEEDEAYRESLRQIPPWKRPPPDQ